MHVEMMAHASCRAYLAAMIDGEGCVTKYDGTGGSRRVCVANTDPDIIAACEECLRVLDIPYRVYMPKHRPENRRKIWHLVVTRREGLVKIDSLVPIRSTRKKARLREIVESYRFNPPPDDIATALYLGGMTMKAIGSLYGCSEYPIRRILMRCGVPRRQHPRLKNPVDLNVPVC